jgi:hypothetical protein
MVHYVITLGIVVHALFGDVEDVDAVTGEAGGHHPVAPCFFEGFEGKRKKEWSEKKNVRARRRK